MSKIGKLPIAIPAWVTISADGQTITVKGPKGELSYTHRDEVNVAINDSDVTVTIDNDEYKSYWGLTRTLINNMVVGVTQGYEKKLLVLWVGYDAKLQGTTLILNLGYSHPVHYPIPDWITIVTEKDPKGNPVVAIQWINKQKVGEVAAKIRKFRAPEPYKGKGVRYIDEVVKLKAGKSAKK